MPYKNPEARKRYQDEYNLRHRERKIEQARAWVSVHREYSDAYQKQYRETNRESRAAYARKAYADNPTLLKARQKEWLKRNPDWRKKNYHAHIERQHLRARESYERHREKRIAAAVDYAKRNPHIGAKRHAVRRLRKEATLEGETAIATFIKSVRCARRIACYYCKKLIRGKSAHIDHIVPLSRGGCHAPNNLCAACPPCNLTKSAKLLAEWKPAGQQVLPL